MNLSWAVGKAKHWNGFNVIMATARLNTSSISEDRRCSIFLKKKKRNQKMYKLYLKNMPLSNTLPERLCSDPTVFLYWADKNNLSWHILQEHAVAYTITTFKTKTGVFFMIRDWLNTAFMTLNLLLIKTFWYIPSQPQFVRQTQGYYQWESIKNITVKVSAGK